MRKLLPLLLFAALFAACIDQDYNLENLDTDNVTIGGDESTFEIPLARVLVTLADIAKPDGNQSNNIQQLCEKADKWLPRTLPGNADYVDLTQLSRSSYTDGLFDALVAEMQSGSAKLNEVTDMIWDDYRDDLADALGISASLENETIFKGTFKLAVRNTEQRVLDEVKSQFSGYLTDDLGVDPIDYQIGRVDISDDVVNMIADNLDPQETVNPKNTLYLAGEIVSKLPISLLLEPELISSAAGAEATFLKFDIRVDATRESNAIEATEQTRLYAESLRQLVNDASIRIPVTLEKYYPGRGFDTGTAPDGTAIPQIEFRLHLIKNGGLKLDI